MVEKLHRHSATTDGLSENGFSQATPRNASPGNERSVDNKSRRSEEDKNRLEIPPRHRTCDLVNQTPKSGNEARPDRPEPVGCSARQSNRATHIMVPLASGFSEDEPSAATSIWLPMMKHTLEPELAE
ncbi:aspartic proteinase-like protein 1-like protein [Anopheles sinensis]|uniref:Aspartic proteinase-like protein 1-like protein n=1 Tax=Anopheles sinensis TaxID=74873 RepID=A0A084VM66_ANOSI|nr:aspartic proteinase-like protein 1-like protein [Anopheles sinensis]